MGAPSRRWCFTTFNTEEIKKSDDVNYLVYGLEKCPKTGREHLQGYIEMKKPKRLAGMKKQFPTIDHFEAAKGTAEQNISYCTKDGNAREQGTHIGQGHRSDLGEVVKMIRQKKSLREITENNMSTMIKYHKGIEKVMNIMSEQRTEAPMVFVFTGPSGVGKSRLAKIWAGPEAFWKPVGQWWDGYDNQESVVIDDFDGAESLPREELLRVLDRYPLQVQVKGGFKQFNSKRIFITSNKNIEDWYPFSYIKPLLRRVMYCKRWEHVAAPTMP